METTTGTENAPEPSTVIELPASFPVQEATLGRQPNNDPDNSCAMWFE